MPLWPGSPSGDAEGALEFPGEGHGALDGGTGETLDVDGSVGKALGETLGEEALEPFVRLPDAAREADAHPSAIRKHRLDVPGGDLGQGRALLAGEPFGVGGPGVEIGGEGEKKAGEKRLGIGRAVDGGDEGGRLARAEHALHGGEAGLGRLVRVAQESGEEGASVAKAGAVVAQQIAPSAGLHHAALGVEAADQRTGARENGDRGALGRGGVSGGVIGFGPKTGIGETSTEQREGALALGGADQAREGPADVGGGRAPSGRAAKVALQKLFGGGEQIGGAALTPKKDVAPPIDRHDAAGGAAAVQSDEDGHGREGRLPARSGYTLRTLATRVQRPDGGFPLAEPQGGRRVLVSMKVYLGDAVMAAPSLDALEAAGWNVTLLTAPLAAEALGRPSVVPYEKGRWPWKTLAQAHRLRAMGFDACVLVNRSVRAALLAKLAGIPIRIGHPVEGRGSLLTHRVAYDPSLFEATSTAELIRPLQVEVANPIPRVSLTDAERRAGDERRDGADLAIQPGARYDLKRLPLPALIDAARAWQAAGRRIVMVGGPDERTETDALIAGLDAPVVDLVGRCGVRETMAVLAGASVAVGADTGVMHLAVAVGCPTVQAFGPTPVAKWGHAYAPHRILTAPDGCMASLTAGELLSAVGAR